MKLSTESLLAADWWPKPWRIDPTKLIVARALLPVAAEVLRRAEAYHAPLHRLRYRWSLRRRAPAWKRRAAAKHRAAAFQAKVDEQR